MDVEICQPSGKPRDDKYRVRRYDDRRLSAVERALQKIQEGTYGLSEVSGDPIPTARLKAIPEALLTVEEVAQAEKHQR